MNMHPKNRCADIYAFCGTAETHIGARMGEHQYHHQYHRYWYTRDGLHYAWYST